MSLEMHMDHLDSGILDYHISSVAITESSSQVSSNSSNVRQKRQYESIALCTVVRVAFYKHTKWLQEILRHSVYSIR